MSGLVLVTPVKDRL